jgi:hypothetical protein
MAVHTRHEIGNPTKRMLTDRVKPRRYPPRLVFLEESGIERAMHRR